MVTTGGIESTTVLKRLGPENAKKVIEKKQAGEVIRSEKAALVIAEKKRVIAEKKQSQRICRLIVT